MSGSREKGANDGGDRVSKVSRNTQVNELETWYGVTADDHLARDLTIPVVTGAVTLVVVGGDRVGTGKEGERMSKMKMHCVIHNAERAVEEAPDACWEFDGVDDCLFLDPADVVELARQLPGAEEVCECGKPKKWHKRGVMPHYRAAALVIPLPEGEEK